MSLKCVTIAFRVHLAVLIADLTSSNIVSNTLSTIDANVFPGLTSLLTLFVLQAILLVSI